MTSAADATFEQWLDYYTSHFSHISDDALKGYWYMFGRDSEETAPPRAMAAWAAVNQEMWQRMLD